MLDAVSSVHSSVGEMFIWAHCIFGLNAILEVYIKHVKIQKQRHWIWLELELSWIHRKMILKYTDRNKEVYKWRGRNNLHSRQTDQYVQWKDCRLCHFNRRNWKWKLFLFTSVFFLIKKPVSEVPHTHTHKWFAYIHVFKLLFAFMLYLVYWLLTRHLSLFKSWAIIEN